MADKRYYIANVVWDDGEGTWALGDWPEAAIMTAIILKGPANRSGVYEVLSTTDPDAKVNGWSITCKDGPPKRYDWGKISHANYSEDWDAVDGLTEQEQEERDRLPMALSVRWESERLVEDDAA